MKVSALGVTPPTLMSAAVAATTHAGTLGVPSSVLPPSDIVSMHTVCRAVQRTLEPEWRAATTVEQEDAQVVPTLANERVLACDD